MPSTRRDLRLSMGSISVPHLFRCPISLDLLRDPVTLCTGQTYERSSIEKWIAEGNLTCPVTMQKLHDLSLIPNHTLRRVIQDWCVANRAHGVDRIPTPKHPIDAHQVTRLKHDLRNSCNRGLKLQSIKRIKALSKEMEQNRELMLNMEMLPLLVTELLNLADAEAAADQADWELAEEALGALLQMAPTAQGIRLMCPAGLGDTAFRSRSAFVAASLLQNGSMEARINAGSLIDILCNDAASADHLGQTPGTIEGLVSLIQQANDYPRAVKVGIRALFSLCLADSNREPAARTGAAEALIEALVNIDKPDVSRALATIELLCKTETGLEAVCRHALAVPVLVKHIFKVSEDSATESATAILLAICSGSEDIQKEAVQAGAFTRLLLVLQSHCSCRAKRKARTLLKLLKHIWSEDPCTDVVSL